MRFFNLQITLLMTLISVLSGCMVGPQFHSPAAPKTTHYTPAPAPTKTVSTPERGEAGQTQHFTSTKHISAQWWSLFHSIELNELILKGFANSPNLAAARATLHQAQETYRAQWGTSLFPQVDAQLTGQRERFSGASLGSGASSTFNLFNASVNVSYTLDFFGAARRQLEALCAQVDYQRYQLEGAYLTLTSNITTTAITAASLQAQIDATNDLIRLQEDQLRIVNTQFNLGGASRTDVLTQQSELATTKASLPPLLQRYAQSQHALAVLIGEFPSEAELPRFNLKKLSLPTDLPVTLPSYLVRQRPDIRASEALLHQASANVGVATANLFPQLTLTGSYGWTGSNLPNLFQASNAVWNASGQLLQPIFHGGALLAQRRAAIAAYESAAAQYRQTVLVAFQNVADTLRALENDAKTLKAQSQAEIAARKALDLVQKQYKLGGVSYLSLITAQRQYRLAYINRIQAEAARYADTAALFQALGGGWWTCKTIL